MYFAELRHLLTHFFGPIRSSYNQFRSRYFLHDVLDLINRLKVLLFGAVTASTFVVLQDLGHKKIARSSHFSEGLGFGRSCSCQYFECSIKFQND